MHLLGSIEESNWLVMAIILDTRKNLVVLIQESKLGPKHGSNTRTWNSTNQEQKQKFDPFETFKIFDKNNFLENAPLEWNSSFQRTMALVFMQMVAMVSGELV